MNECLNKYLRHKLDNNYSIFSKENQPKQNYNKALNLTDKIANKLILIMFVVQMSDYL